MILADFLPDRQPGSHVPSCHLQWVCGDYAKELKILGEMLGLSVEVFA